MDLQRSFYSQVIMSVLSANLSLVSTISNGSFLAVFVRFKNLRNVPNIFFANLAVVDFLNALLNLPLFVLFYVWRASWLSGKTWAIIVCSLHLDLTFLNIVSMFALMLDRFLALYLDLKYFTWKTTKKAYVAVFLMWLVSSTIAVAIASSTLLGMDLDGVHVKESRAIIFHRINGFTGSIAVIFVTAVTALGIMTIYEIRRKKKQRMLLNLPPLQAEARLKMEIKASKTVAMAVGTFLICYIPGIVYTAWRRNSETTIHPWITFMTYFCTCVSSASNPIIYVLRNGRYRSAIKQLEKDPCGRTLFQERPVRKGNEKVQRQNNPRSEAARLEGGKTRACARPDENPESEARGPTTSLPGSGPEVGGPTKATRQMAQCRGEVKIAWQ